MRNGWMDDWERVRSDQQATNGWMVKCCFGETTKREFRDDKQRENRENAAAVNQGNQSGDHERERKRMSQGFSIHSILLPLLGIKGSSILLIPGLIPNQ